MSYHIALTLIILGFGMIVIGLGERIDLLPYALLIVCTRIALVTVIEKQKSKRKRKNEK